MEEILGAITNLKSTKNAKTKAVLTIKLKARITEELRKYTNKLSQLSSAISLISNETATNINNVVQQAVEIEETLLATKSEIEDLDEKIRELERNNSELERAHEKMSNKNKTINALLKVEATIIEKGKEYQRKKDYVEQNKLAEIKSDIDKHGAHIDKSYMEMRSTIEELRAKKSKKVIYDARLHKLSSSKMNVAALLKMDNNLLTIIEDALTEFESKIAEADLTVGNRIFTFHDRIKLFKEITENLLDETLEARTNQLATTLKQLEVDIRSRIDNNIK